MLIIESKFSTLRTLFDGLLTTTINSYSALGPSLRVILFVSSLEIGFSMYQASCLNSLLTMLSLPVCYEDEPLDLLVSEEVLSMGKGRSEVSNFS
jgi:hypothetical protein